MDKYAIQFNSAVSETLNDMLTAVITNDTSALNTISYQSSLRSIVDVYYESYVFPSISEVSTYMYNTFNWSLLLYTTAITFRDDPVSKYTESTIDIDDIQWNYLCSQYTSSTATKDCASFVSLVSIADIFNNTMFDELLQLILNEELKNYTNASFLLSIQIQKYMYFHEQFEILAIESNSQNWTSSESSTSFLEYVDIKIPDYVAIFVYSIVGLCVILAALGMIHAYVIKADNIRISGCIYLGLYTLDFYSDIVFSIEILSVIVFYDNSYQRIEAKIDILWVYCMLVFSWIFMIVPWVANMKQLLSFEEQWCDDPIVN